MSHPSGRISLPSSSSSSSGNAPPSTSFFSSPSSSTAPTSLVAVWVLLGALGSLLLLWAVSYLALRQWDRRRSPSRSDNEANSGRRLWRLPICGPRRHHRAQQPQQRQPPSYPLQIMIGTDTTERWEERAAQSDGHEQHEVPLGLSSSATAKPSPATPQPSIELRPTSSPPQSGSQARSAPTIRWLIPPPATSQPPPSLGQAVLLSEVQAMPAPRAAPFESSSATMPREVSWYEAMQDVTLADPTMWTMPSRRASEEEGADEEVTDATHGHGREAGNGTASH